MRETVTVDQVLRKGRWKLKYLPMIANFCCIVAGFILADQQILGDWIIPIGFVAGFIMSWILWSCYVIEWKIWAYENVRNIHELQRKAVDEKLIWKAGSWFEKIEFKNYQQKQKLKQLEKKFIEKDIFKDDISVPKETVIFYSRNKILFGLVLSLGISLLGIYFLYEKEYFGLILLGLGLYLAFSQIKNISDKSPQIVINDKGIKLKNEKLISWNKIHDDKVYSRNNGKSSTNYFAFNDEEIIIDDLKIKLEQL